MFGISFIHFRLFQYKEDTREFKLIGQSNYHDHCVLCVKHLIFESSGMEKNAANQKKCYICSSATDGKIAFWDTTQMLLRAFHYTSEVDPSSDTNGAKANCDIVYDSERTLCENIVYLDSGDTSGSRFMADGTIDLGVPGLVISCHQSGINALDALHVKGIHSYPI